MLEEAVNNERNPPAETALAMLSFLQSELPAGGAAAESRFFKLYGPLCDRIFGPILLPPPTSPSSSSPSSGATTTEEYYSYFRHQSGGWLGYTDRWNPRPSDGAAAAAAAALLQSPSSSSSNQQHPLRGVGGVGRRMSGGRNNRSSLDDDPVVMLLGTPPPTTGSGGGIKSPSTSNRNRGRLASSSHQSYYDYPPTLIEAISNESDSRPSVEFALRFHALPQPLQDAWLALLLEVGSSATPTTSRTGGNNDVLPGVGGGGGAAAEVAVENGICTENDRRLLAVLLRKRPEAQQQLWQYKQQQMMWRNRQQQQQENVRQYQPLTPRGFNIGPASNTTATPFRNSPTLLNHNQPFMTSPGMDIRSSSPMAKADGSEIRPPNVMLSMLEYYLFLFFRFPLAAPDRNNKTSSIPGVNSHRIPSSASSSRSRRSTSTRGTPYGNTIYEHIFRRYVRHFLLYHSSPSEVAAANATNNDRSIALTDHRESELFLRILIAFWLESSPARLCTTSKAVQSIQVRRNRSGLHSPTGPVQFDLNASYELVQQQQHQPAVSTVHTPKFDPPSTPPLVHKCVRILVTYVLLDPQVARDGRDRDLAARGRWCMTNVMTALQQPVYNYIRTHFRYDTVHASDSAFHWALSCWLLWLEPWNVIHASKSEFSAKKATERIMSTVSGGSSPRNSRPSSSLTIPKYNQRSRYHSAWEPYIVANLHLYTVPLAIFLRRARELDFSGGKFQRSLQIVKRVFRVFTPEVVDVLSRHLENSDSSRFSHLVRRHVEVLGPCAPPPGALSLASLKMDMESLMEEIDLQHLKKLRELDTFDKLVNKLESFFGKGVESGEEKALESLIERAKLIARLPIEYDILHRMKTQTLDQQDGTTVGEQQKMRTDDGLLTDYGKYLLVSGYVKCDKSEAHYIGDPMRARHRPHEISLLVDLNIWLCDILNEKLGLNGDGNFRINLRFFADYRNALFILVTFYLLLKLVF